MEENDYSLKIAWCVSLFANGALSLTHKKAPEKLISGAKKIYIVVEFTV